MDIPIVNRSRFAFQPGKTKLASAHHIAILAISVAFVYWRVSSFSFLTGWDDQWFVMNAYTEGGFGWDNFYAILTDFYYGQYAPVNQLYYTLLYTLFGYNTACFHIASVALHLVNVLLVYYFAGKLAGALTNDILQSRRISFIAALFFSVLPVNLEAVAWVSASKVLIYGLFYLLALLSYYRYLTSGKVFPFYLTILWFVIAFGAKEQAVTLPFCLLLLDHLYKRNLHNRNVWVEKIPFFILSIFFGVITIQSQEIHEDRPFYNLYQRVPLGFYTLIEYFTKCMLPVNLSYLYPFPFQVGEKVPGWLWIYTAAVVVATWCLGRYFRRAWVFYGLSFFLIHIMLVLHFVPVGRFSVLADRYAYVASIGLCFTMAYAFVILAARSRHYLLFKVAVTAYFCILLLYSSLHITVWKNTAFLKEKLKNTIEARSDFPELLNYNK